MIETNVIRLIDKAPGYPPEDIHGLCEWLRAWADHLEKPGDWMPRSLVLVIESDNGGLAAIAQSLESMDKSRIVGLLQMAAIRKCEGSGTIEDLRP